MNDEELRLAAARADVLDQAKRDVFDKYHVATGGTCVFGRPAKCVHALQVREVIAVLDRLREKV